MSDCWLYTLQHVSFFQPIVYSIILIIEMDRAVIVFISLWLDVTHLFPGFIFQAESWKLY